MLSFVTTRELRLVYFDGSGANKMNSGTVDTQDILTRGSLLDARAPWDEYGRAHDLCEWGKQYHIDGYLRSVISFAFYFIHFAEHSFRMEPDL
jgi:hypothetical protein